MTEGLTARKMILIVLGVGLGTFLIVSTIALPSPPRAPELKTVRLNVIPGRLVNVTETVVIIGSAWDAAGKNVTANATWAWTFSNPTLLQLLPSAAASILRATAVATGTVDVAVNVTYGNVAEYAVTTLTIQPAPLAVQSLTGSIEPKAEAQTCLSLRARFAMTLTAVVIVARP